MKQNTDNEKPKKLNYKEQQEKFISDNKLNVNDPILVDNGNEKRKLLIVEIKNDGVVLSDGCKYGISVLKKVS